MWTLAGTMLVKASSQRISSDQTALSKIHPKHLSNLLAKPHSHLRSKPVRPPLIPPLKPSLELCDSRSETLVDFLRASIQPPLQFAVPCLLFHTFVQELENTCSLLWFVCRVSIEVRSPGQGLLQTHWGELRGFHVCIGSDLRRVPTLGCQERVRSMVRSD